MANVHGDDLPRNPLAEVVFELRWKLTGGPPAPTPPIDPGYKLMVGSFYDRVKDEYPVHEQLPSATIPDEFAPHIVQHRFRRAENGYPLVQVGPGIFAANDAAAYSWKTYLPRVLEAVAKLRDTYAVELAPESFMLRYINTAPFDFAIQDLLTYLSESLKVSVVYPQKLFTGQPVEQRPSAFTLQSDYRLTDPKGLVVLKIGSGEVSGQKRLVWETLVQSAGEDVPPLEELESWLERAHSVARSWFFTLIEGRLEASYRE
jgi:uncharacterized protein (TIGR04255 family)